MRQPTTAEREAFVISFCITLIFGMAAGCAHTLTPAEQKAAELAAENAYTTELLVCTANSSTREQADSCTDAVNERYGRLPDGGRK